MAAAPQLRALITNDPDVRVEAAYTFAQLDTPTRDADLIALAAHPNPQVRATAVQRLESIRDTVEPAEFTRSVAAGLRDLDASVRVAALRLLRAASTDADVELVQQGLADERVEVRRAAVEALSVSEHPRAARALAGMSRSDDAAIRAASITGLMAVGDSASRARLADLLDDVDLEVAAGAVRGLAQLQEPALIEILQLRHSAAAAIALGEVGDPRGLEPLLAAAGDPRIGESLVAKALGDLGDRRAVPWLIERLTRFDHNTAGEAAAALGRLNDPRGVDPLIGLLTSARRGVAMNAATALAELGESPRVVPPLLAAYVRSLDSRDWDIQNATGAALARRGSDAVPMVAALLRTRPRDRELVIRALGLFGPEATPTLVGALDLDGRHDRLAAAAALANREDPLVEAALMARLQPLDLDVVGGAHRFFLKRLDDRVVDALVRAVSEAAQRGSEQARAYVVRPSPPRRRWPRLSPPSSAEIASRAPRKPTWSLFARRSGPFCLDESLANDAIDCAPRNRGTLDSSDVA